MIKQQPGYLSHWIVMNWMTSALRSDSRLQQSFFSPPECVPGSTTAAGTTQSPVLWVRRTRPRGKSCCAFCRWNVLKIDYCNQSPDYSYFLMDVKSMIRKRRNIHSCHEILAFHFVKFSVKQTYKERIMENYEFCATAFYRMAHEKPARRLVGQHGRRSRTLYRKLNKSKCKVLTGFSNQ